MKTRELTIVVMLLVASTASLSAATNAVDEKIQQQAQAAMSRGIQWLESQQAADGRLGPEKYPAVTALALTALKSGGSTNVTAIARAEKYVHDFLGRKSTDSLASYNADVCNKVLGLATGNKQPTTSWAAQHAKIDRDYSISARDFELRQIAWQKERAQLAQEGKGDPDRLMAGKIAASIINPQSSAPSAMPSAPRASRRGYGSMTYEGMMKLVEGDVASDDPRVDAMLDWASRGFRLDERDGKGQAGIFFFYQGMAKCLNASGESVINPIHGGTPVKWREQLIRKMISLQKSEGSAGYWVNTDKSYMEDDPVLVTAYALLTLESAMGGAGSSAQ